MNSISKIPHNFRELIDAHSNIISLTKTISNCIKMIDNWSESFLDINYLSSLLLRQNFNTCSCKKIVTSLFWSFFVKKTPLFNSMTENAKNSLLEKIDKEPPDFSEYEISVFLNNVERFYTDNAMQTIKEVYKCLIGCTYYGTSWNDRKIDNLQLVSSSFRIAGNIEYDGFNSRFYYQLPYHSFFSYEDFLSACYLLDGKPKPPPSANSSFASLAESAFRAGCSSVKTPYFTVYCYKNGNQKVVFSRDKFYILHALNRFGSNNELPDTMKKRYKPEHFSTAEATA